MTKQESYEKLLAIRIRPVRKDGVFLVSDPTDRMVTASGIEVVLREGSATNNVIRGKVFSIGSDIDDINIGDTVTYRKGYGNRMKYDDIEFFYLTENQIDCVES